MRHDAMATSEEYEERRRKLADGLLSGRWVQGRQFLRGAGDERCCLGVACEVMHEETGRGEWVRDTELDGVECWFFNVDSGEGTYVDSSSRSLPAPVQDWYGFSGSEGSYTVWPGVFRCLTEDNDAGEPLHRTFPEIAELIKSEPDGMFDQLGEPD